MLCRLACKNISKSVRDYAVYFLTLVLGVSIFYMFNSLDSQSVASVLDDSASSTMQMLSGVMVIVSVFVAGVFCFLIVYANRFLMKRRKQEFALYMMLGMGKLRISALLVFETLIIGIASLAVGLVLGIALSQALSLIVVSMFEADMSGYVFAFSPLALFLTIFCFSFMYFWVMVFNTISITRSSLADLLRSRLRNERIPYRHPWLCLLVFAIGVLLLSYAYYRVTVGVDAMVSPGILGWMIVLDIVATFLIIWSLSGLLLRIALSRKRFYYRDLNSFTLREIHAHIHSTITAMSIICILLFFTICIFSSAMSANLFTARQLQESLPCDLMITKTMELPEDVGFDEGAIARSRLGILEELEKNGFDRTRLTNAMEVRFYVVGGEEEIRLRDTMNASTQAWLQENYPTVTLDALEMFMEVSDYNRLARLFHNEEIALQEDTYAIVADTDVWIQLRSRAMAAGSTVTVNGKTLSPNDDQCTYGNVEMSASRTNGGILIVPDGTMKREQLQYQRLFADYRAADTIGKQGAEEALTDFLDAHGIAWNSNGTGTSSQPDVYALTTRLAIRENVRTISLMVIFIGLYLGIVFLISSAVVLALKQLAQCSDSRPRYDILRKLGISERELRRSLFIQTAVFFLLPLVLALIHSIFGLQFCSLLLSMMGVESMLGSVIPTILLLVGIYGSYFLITYLCSRSILSEGMEDGGVQDF